MAYRNKDKTSKSSILSQVKDLSKLVIGDSYHLRKKLSQDGNVIKDEVHDVVFKELLDSDFVDESGNKYSTTEFRIYIRKPL